MNTVLRNLGLVILAAGAALSFVYLAPKAVVSDYTVPSATTYESLISSVLADDVLNNTRTEGAPQQTVVNGWTARDLLTIIAKENADILRAQGAVVDATGNLQTQPFDQRVPALLLLGVLTLCWLGLTAPRPSVVASPQAVSPGLSESPSA